MARLLLLVAIAIPAWVAWQRFKNLSPPQRKKALWQLGLTALVVLLLLLILTGRIHWLTAVVAALIPLVRATSPLLLRLLPGFIQSRQARANRQTRNADGQSTVSTSLLTLVLDHHSGNISGTVLKGNYTGRSLDELNDEDLLSLYQTCVQHDADSARLLSSYLDQRLGQDWGSAQQGPADSSAGDMSRDVALAILSLEPGATRKQILAAHRRLIQKLHPDRGGNDYLAAQLNRARDCLLSGDSVV